MDFRKKGVNNKQSNLSVEKKILGLLHPPAGPSSKSNTSIKKSAVCSTAVEKPSWEPPGRAKKPTTTKCASEKVKQESIKDPISIETSQETSTNTSSSSFPTPKLCRVCLKSGVIPIYTQNMYSVLANQLNLICGINIKHNDEHPQHLCENCNQLLEDAVHLRITAQTTQLQLGSINLKTKEKSQKSGQSLIILSPLTKASERNKIKFHIGQTTFVRQKKDNSVQNIRYFINENKETIAKREFIDFPQNNIQFDDKNKDYEISDKSLNSEREYLTIEYNEILKSEEEEVIESEEEGDIKREPQLIIECEEEQIIKHEEEKFIKYEEGNVMEGKEETTDCEDNEEIEWLEDEYIMPFRNKDFNVKPTEKKDLEDASEQKRDTNHRYDDSDDSDVNSMVLNDNILVTEARNLKKKEKAPKQRENLREYYKRVTTAENKLVYSCTLCDKVFRTREVSHIRQHFSDVPLFVCQVCGKAYDSANQLSSHVSKHKAGKLKTGKSLRDFYKRAPTAEDKPVYLCTLCNKVFKQREASHIRQHFSDVPLFVCHMCGKVHDNALQLSRHISNHKKWGTFNKDTDELKYMCDHCPYKGRVKALLINHMKVHYKEHKYVCPICTKKFRQACNYSRHMRRHEEPRFKCDHCSKLFYDNCFMKKHIARMHTDTSEKFNCKICGNAFKCKSGLYSHELKVHQREVRTRNRAHYLVKAVNNE